MGIETPSRRYSATSSAYSWRRRRQQSTAWTRTYGGSPSSNSRLGGRRSPVSPAAAAMASPPSSSRHSRGRGRHLHYPSSGEMRQLRGAASGRGRGRRKVDIFSRARLARLLSAFEHSTQAHDDRLRRHHHHNNHHDHHHHDHHHDRHEDGILHLGLAIQLGGGLFGDGDGDGIGTEAILNWLGLRNMR